jgi:uncharacterized protein
MIISESVDIVRVLTEARVIAVVGLSARPERPSYRVAQFMLARGYRIVPVNPQYAEVLGQTCYPQLSSIPFAVDMVDVFRQSEHVLPVAEAAIGIGAKCLWLQLGVIHPAAIALADAAGLNVVVDRCTKVEYARLFGLAR